MIAKLEDFSGHCHIAPDQLGLERLFPVWTILCAQLWNVFFPPKNSDFPVYFAPSMLIKFPKDSDPPVFRHLMVVYFLFSVIKIKIIEKK